MSKKKKFYTVWVGHEPGVYENWSDCLAQTKNYPGAKYKSFKSRQEAENALDADAREYISRSKGSNLKKASGQMDLSQFGSAIIRKSVSVDAACSGNPGIMEYRCVDTFSRDEIFRKGPFKDGTNNIGEFLGLVHAIALYKKLGNPVPIYTDSRTAMAWVRNKKVKTTLSPNKNNAVLFDMITRAEKWLHNNSYSNNIIKWDTKNWGEIPADFGRK